MRVRFQNAQLKPTTPGEPGYVSSEQLFLTPASVYSVHAVSVYEELTFLLVVDDTNTPCFLPRFLFEMVEPSVPDDWICNVFSNGPVQLVLGPSFIAKDLVSYNAMVDQEFQVVEQLFFRIKPLSDAGT